MPYTEILTRIPQKLLDAGFPSATDKKYILKWDDEKKPGEVQTIGFNSVLWHEDIGKWVLENIKSIRYTGERTQ